MKSHELIARPLRKNFNTAIVIVANPSGDAEHVGLALDKPAETDTLHTSADEVALCFNRFFGGSHLQPNHLERLQGSFDSTRGQ